MKVDMLYYREWASGLCSQVEAYCRFNKIECHNHMLLEDCCQDADLTFLIGWSDIVPVEMYKARTFLALHPSYLPNYRGGSPIQNQIIDGLTSSAVSIFKLDERYPGMDTGPMYEEQLVFSLEGELQEILTRIVILGTRLVERVIRSSLLGTLRFVPQPDGGFAVRRRRPEESEISLEEIRSKPASYLYNKIRALQDPYPNAFIVCADGQKVYLTKAHL